MYEFLIKAKSHQTSVKALSDM